MRLYWNCNCFIRRSSNNPFSPWSIIKSPEGAWSKVPYILNLRTKFREVVRFQLRDSAALCPKNEPPMPTASGTRLAPKSAIKGGENFLSLLAVQSTVTSLTGLPWLIFFNVLPQWANGDIATSMLNIRTRRRRAAASGFGHFNLCDRYRECPVAATSLGMVIMGTFSPPAGNVSL